RGAPPCISQIIMRQLLTKLHRLSQHRNAIVLSVAVFDEKLPCESAGCGFLIKESYHGRARISEVVQRHGERRILSCEAQPLRFRHVAALEGTPRLLIEDEAFLTVVVGGLRNRQRLIEQWLRLSNALLVNEETPNLPQSDALGMAVAAR